MKILKSGLISLFLLFACFATTNAFAQADKSGLEIRAGVVVPYFVGASASVSDDVEVGSVNNLKAVGVGVNLQLLYRWTYFGLGIDQMVSGIFALDNSFSLSISDTDWDLNGYEKGDGLFYGATFFVLKEYIPIGSTHLITFGEGIGATYGANKKHQKVYETSSDAAFAFKFEIGYTYFLFDLFGIGLNLEYTGSLAIDNGVSYSSAIVPQIMFDIVF